jgi:type I restriction enzyme S subunit
MKILHPKDEFVNIKFVFYYMQTVHIKSETHKRYWISEYSKLPIPLPPLPEQNQIVAKIEELFSELENGKQRLETIKQQLKTYRQVVLKWAFEGRFTSVGTNRDLSRPNNILNTLPEGWKWVKVSEIGKIETGSTPSKKISTYYSNDFPFYKPTDLEAGYNVRSSSDNLSKLGIKEARFLPENSILVTCIGATIGKSGIIRTAGASNQQINAIIPSEKVNPNFVYYQAIAPLFQKSIKRNASSTTLPILNKTKFMNLEMILCPVKEQTAIVLEIETRLSVCDKMEETINNCLQYTESLRQSILKQAFEGKLVKTI